VSAMSAAGSAARSALSLWSDALINRVRPSAAAVASSRLHAITRPRDRGGGAAKRSMGHSSWKKRTGAELHRLYARPGAADCRALPAARQSPDEERLLRGLGGPARRLFRDRGDLEGEVRGNVKHGPEAAVRRGIEDA